MKLEKSEKSEFLTALGKKIKSLRKDKGMSQAELANVCGKDRQSLERVENGRINPTIHYLKTIAEGLEINLKDLIDI
ncbi:MAG: helix-turn-helix domain-containing protein [Bacteroidia bacterium]